MPPCRNAVDVSDEERAGQFPGGGRRLEQAQASPLGQAVGFAAVHVLAGQDAVSHEVLPHQDLQIQSAVGPWAH